MAKHFLGIDVGSSYTKFAAIDNSGSIDYVAVIPTLSRSREEYGQVMEEVRKRFAIGRVCATGYGRQQVESDLQKTELVCASAGVSFQHPVHKCIIDIGGEDIKIIESDASGNVVNFYMNDKCSAGTGTFVTEIAERAELDLSEMSALSRKSTSDRIINSFCTVFAKSEILGWKFSGVPIEDIARGIYLSIVDRVRKLPVKKGLPVFLCGGVIAFHPVLAELIMERIQSDIKVVTQPQFVIALGAAVLAQKDALRALATR